MNVLVQALGTARIKLEIWRHNRRLVPAKASLVWKQPCNVRNTWLMMWQPHQVQAKHAKYTKRSLPAACFEHLLCTASRFHNLCKLSGFVECCLSPRQEAPRQERASCNMLHETELRVPAFHHAAQVQDPGSATPDKNSAIIASSIKHQHKTATVAPTIAGCST